MTDEEFERAIEEALDGMPEQFLEIGRASCRERV